MPPYIPPGLQRFLGSTFTPSPPPQQVTGVGAGTGSYQPTGGIGGTAPGIGYVGVGSTGGTGGGRRGRTGGGTGGGGTGGTTTTGETTKQNIITTPTTQPPQTPPGFVGKIPSIQGGSGVTIVQGGGTITAPKAPYLPTTTTVYDTKLIESGGGVTAIPITKTVPGSSWHSYAGSGTITPTELTTVKSPDYYGEYQQNVRKTDILNRPINYGADIHYKQLKAEDEAQRIITNQIKRITSETGTATQNYYDTLIQQKYGGNIKDGTFYYSSEQELADYKKFQDTAAKQAQEYGNKYYEQRYKETINPQDIYSKQYKTQKLVTYTKEGKEYITSEYLYGKQMEYEETKADIEARISGKQGGLMAVAEEARFISASVLNPTILTGTIYNALTGKKDVLEDYVGATIRWKPKPGEGYGLEPIPNLMLKSYTEPGGLGQLSLIYAGFTTAATYAPTLTTLVGTGIMAPSAAFEVKQAVASGDLTGLGKFAFENVTLIGAMSGGSIAKGISGRLTEIGGGSMKLGIKEIPRLTSERITYALDKQLYSDIRSAYIEKQYPMKGSYTPTEQLTFNTSGQKFYGAVEYTRTRPGEAMYTAPPEPYATWTQIETVRPVPGSTYGFYDFVGGKVTKVSTFQKPMDLSLSKIPPKAEVPPSDQLSGIMSRPTTKTELAKFEAEQKLYTDTMQLGRQQPLTAMKTYEYVEGIGMREVITLKQTAPQQKLMDGLRISKETPIDLLKTPSKNFYSSDKLTLPSRTELFPSEQLTQTRGYVRVAPATKRFTTFTAKEIIGDLRAVGKKKPGFSKLEGFDYEQGAIIGISFPEGQRPLRFSGGKKTPLIYTREEGITTTPTSTGESTILTNKPIETKIVKPSPRKVELIGDYTSKEFKPSGLYESPELNTGWKYAPLDLHLLERSEQGLQTSSIWKRVRPQGITTPISKTKTEQLITSDIIGDVSKGKQGQMLMGKSETVFGQETSMMGLQETTGRQEPGLGLGLHYEELSIFDQASRESQENIQGMRQEQRQMQGQRYMTELLSKTKTSEKEKTKKPRPLIGDTDEEDLLGKKSKRYKKGKTSGGLAMGEKGIMADLLSATQSQARYGKATQPEPTPGLFEASEKTLFIRVPTKELMGKPERSLFGSQNNNKNMRGKKNVRYY